MNLSKKKILFGLVIMSMFAQMLFAKDNVVRVIDSANPEPQVYEWHEHGRLGIEPTTFVSSEKYNRVKLREASGKIVEVPFFHFTARDLGELLNKLAKFPAKTKVIDCSQNKTQPLVNIKADNLPLGPLAEWPNTGYLGGAFKNLNKPPVVEKIQGRKAVKFSYREWPYDTEYNAMVLDSMPEKALDDNKPFTLSAWVMHPDLAAAGEPEAIMSWHNRNGNDGSTMDWKMGSVWGGFYVAGMGSMYYAPEQGGTFYNPYYQRAGTKEWTHVAYVYSGGGIKGNMKVYENGKLLKTFNPDYVPEVLDAINITKDSVVLKGNLHTVSNDVQAYVRGYIGEYDAHHFGQLRHIGRWDQMNEIGLKSNGEFEIPFENLKPGTRYYYRMFASTNPESYAHAYEYKRRWGNACGSFVTAKEDGTKGKMIARDEDRYIFLGVQWGSKWYSSYPGPAGFFVGYYNELKLFDTALNADQVRAEAKATAVSECQPKNKSAIIQNHANFSWKTGVSTATKFKFYISTNLDEISNRTANVKIVTASEIANIDLMPGRTHYWCVDSLDKQNKVLAAGNVYEFKCSYGEPVELFPKDDTTVSATKCFNWKNTVENLKSQKMYIGTNQTSVTEGTSKEITFRDNQFDTEIRDEQYKLDFGQKYYWRVQTELKDGTIIPGVVWSFSIYDYYEPEFDGVSIEPYLANYKHRRASRVINTFSHPILSTPRADADELRKVQNGIERYVLKDERYENSLANFHSATIMSAYEGGPCVDGFSCGSYGGFPHWNITMHEMGHVTHNALLGLDPHFAEKLQKSFNTRIDNNAWLGAYAAANVGENMACCSHQFIDGLDREKLLLEDPATFYLIEEYLPGDLAIDLHVAYGINLQTNDMVRSWDNRGGIVHKVHGAPYYDRFEPSVGRFEAIGEPSLKSEGGVGAITFDGASALEWDRNLTCGFDKNRAWSIEVWAMKKDDGKSFIVGWGDKKTGVQLLWNKELAWNVGGNSHKTKATLEKDKWYHIALVFEGGGYNNDAGELKLFVNGQEVDSKKYKLDLTKGQKVYIAGMENKEKVINGLKGAIRQIRIYNYDMGVSQLKKHYREERGLYERTEVANIGESLYVDLDINQLKEVGTLHHHPLYPKSLEKGWVRSWSNNGILSGRVHNDVSELWGTSGSTPLLDKVNGNAALLFMGKDHLVLDATARGSMLEQGPETIEMEVFNNSRQGEETVMEWGAFELKAKDLKKGWQHLALIREGSQMVLYIDGKKESKLDQKFEPKRGEHLHLGAHFAPLDESWRHHFYGAISKIRIHKGGLNAVQIAENAKEASFRQANQPIPKNYAQKVVVANKPKLDWHKKGLKQKGEIFIGTATTKMESVGTYAPNKYAPKLKSNRRYFWRVDQGPVWSFETACGKMISLDAADLELGKLTSWPNKGKLGGSFIPAERGNLLGIDIIEYDGVKAFNLVNGRKMNLEFNSDKLKNLAKGSFSIAIKIATVSSTQTAPILNFGNKAKEAQFWYGTHSSDNRLLTLIEKIESNNKRTPEESDIKLSYKKGSNAKMACWWKWLIITHHNGVLEAWYDDTLIERRETSFDLGQLEYMQLGWQREGLDSSIYVNQIQIFDKALSQKEIKGVITQKEDSAVLVKIDASQEKVDTRMLAIKSTGKISADFGLEKQIDRAPEVVESNGEKVVLFKGQQMMLSDFVLPKILANANPFTLEIWVKNNPDSNAGVLMSFSKENSARFTSFLMGTKRNSKAIDTPRRRENEWVITPSDTQKWERLTYVYPGGRKVDLKLYRNGKLNNVIHNQTITTMADDFLSIGGVIDDRKGEARMFNGEIKKIQLYDYAKDLE